MSSITSPINVNVPLDVKEKSNAIFNNLGLNMSTAINMFLKKVISERGIPFDVKEQRPDKELLEAVKELKYMEKHPDKYKSYETIEDLKEALLSDDEI